MNYALLLPARLFLLVGCTTAIQEYAAIDSKNSFPGQVVLEFATVQPQSLKQLEQIPAAWEVITGRETCISDGTTVRFFMDTSMREPFVVHGVVSHGRDLYKLSDLGYVHDLTSIRCDPLGLVFAGEDAEYHLAAAVGAPATGYRYLLYDLYEVISRYQRLKGESQAIKLIGSTSWVMGIFE